MVLLLDHCSLVRVNGFQLDTLLTLLGEKLSDFTSSTTGFITVSSVTDQSFCGAL